ncbi:MAG: phage holin family protein [Ramlibacter sp.]|nr:phage holin family protein [Ramlibacter sp.]
MSLGESLGRLGASSLLVARQRLELASLDVEEELLRLGGLLAGALVTALMLALALAGAAATVVIYFWEEARLAASLGVTAFFCAAAALMAWRLARALRDKPRFLAGTLAELDKDRQQWRDEA